MESASGLGEVGQGWLVEKDVVAINPRLGVKDDGIFKDPSRGTRRRRLQITGSVATIPTCQV